MNNEIVASNHSIYALSDEFFSKLVLELDRVPENKTSVIFQSGDQCLLCVHQSLCDRFVEGQNIKLAAELFYAFWGNTTVKLHFDPDSQLVQMATHKGPPACNWRFKVIDVLALFPVRAELEAIVNFKLSYKLRLLEMD